MALTKAMQDAIAAAVAAALTAQPAQPADAGTKGTRRRTKAAPAAPAAEPTGDVSEPVMVALERDGHYARVTVSRYGGKVRAGIAKAWVNDDGTVGGWAKGHIVPYLTTKAQCDAVIAALTAARKHLP